VKPYLLHREAEQELDAAMAYYEQQRRGLGLELLAEVEQTAELIRRFPEAWPLHGQSGHRKLPLNRFPFTLFYLEHADVIWINAVAHAKRAPYYWRDRV
jgi:toxin ParE1/3/4